MASSRDYAEMYQNLISVGTIPQGLERVSVEVPPIPEKSPLRSRKPRPLRLSSRPSPDVRELPQDPIDTRNPYGHSIDNMSLQSGDFSSLESSRKSLESSYSSSLSDSVPLTPSTDFSTEAYFASQYVLDDDDEYCDCAGPDLDHASQNGFGLSDARGLPAQLHHESSGTHGLVTVSTSPALSFDDPAQATMHSEELRPVASKYTICPPSQYTFRPGGSMPPVPIPACVPQGYGRNEMRYANGCATLLGNPASLAAPQSMHPPSPSRAPRRKHWRRRLMGN